MSERGRRRAVAHPVAPPGPAGTVPVRVSCLICTTPRTGSWLLSEALLQNGSAGRPEEFLRPDWFAQFRTEGRLGYEHRLDHWPSLAGEAPGTAPPSAAEYRRFLEAARAAGTVNGVFAVKIHHNQLHDAVRRLVVDDPGLTDLGFLRWWAPEPRFVHLRRLDTVRRAVSHYRAARSGVWWSYRNGRRRRRSPEDLSVDPEAIHALRLRCEREDTAWENLFTRVGVSPLALSYEELVLDLPGAVAAVLRHLGLDAPSAPFPDRPQLVRQADAWSDDAVHQYVTWLRRRLPEDHDSYGFEVAD